jgi:hypothetical protein
LDRLNCVAQSADLDKYLVQTQQEQKNEINKNLCVGMKKARREECGSVANMTSYAICSEFDFGDS